MTINILVLKNQTPESPAVEISWGIDEMLENDLQENRAIKPFMLLIVVSHKHVWQCKLVPLFLKKTGFTFSLPGKYSVHGLVVWDEYGNTPSMGDMTYWGREGLQVTGHARSTHFGGTLEVKISQDFFSKSLFELWKWRHPFLTRLLCLDGH